MPVRSWRQAVGLSKRLVRTSNAVDVAKSINWDARDHSQSCIRLCGSPGFIMHRPVGTLIVSGAITAWCFSFGAIDHHLDNDPSPSLCLRAFSRHACKRTRAQCQGPKNDVQYLRPGHRLATSFRQSQSSVSAGITDGLVELLAKSTGTNTPLVIV